MRSARLLLATGCAALAAFAAAAAPAGAGQIVYNVEPADGDSQIRVMNDDGSGDRLLVHEDDIPGAEAVMDPYVSPNGSTVVFSARTPGPGGWGAFFCGFRCVGTYALSGGKLQRISQDPIACPERDSCGGLDIDPQITGSGNNLFYELLYYEPSSQPTPNSIRTSYFRSMQPGGGNEVEVGTSQECGKGDNVAVDPSSEGAYALSVYCMNFTYKLKVMNADGSEDTLAQDDQSFYNPAFRGDGQLLVGAEDGNDKGLWTYPRDGSEPRRIANLNWGFSDDRPFQTSPTFIGNDRVAFLFGKQIRTVSTSCNACSIDQTAALRSAPGTDGLAWTSQHIADVSRPSPAPAPVVTPPPAPVVKPVTPAKPRALATLKPLAKAKLRKTLSKGLTVPFVAARSGKLTMEATIAPALAKKLKLLKKRSKTKKPVVVAKGAVTVKKAGNAKVTLKFTKAAKKRLKRAKSVPLTLTGTFAGQPVTGTTRLAK